MPKEIVHIKQFHGGINDASETTDISDNECQIADSCDLSSIGKIVLPGDLKGTDTAPASQVSVTTPGSGLFAFRSDRAADGDNLTCNYYATHNANLVRVWDSDHDTWTSITTSSEWGTSSNCDVEFLFHEGILRQSDAQLIAANQRRWWGYIDRVHFYNVTGKDTYLGMYDFDADLAAPTAGTTASGDSDHTTGVMHFEHNIGGTAGNIPVGSYRLAYSFVYDHHQESLLKEFSGSPVSIAATNSFEAPNFTFHTLPARIAGCRVYIQRADTTDDWTLLVDIHLEKGYRLGLNETYVNTFSGGSDNVIDLTLSGVNITILGNTTYRGINGYGFDEPIDCSYKTAVVVDGMTYAGNILQNGKKYPDRVIKCAMTIFGAASDVFPESNFLNVTPNDGDEIVKLETFQDKVLVFKRQNLFIVNYSESTNQDYLDITHPFMGIRHRAHSFPTAHGIVFMNDLGVHLYNGETITTLTGKMQDLSIPAFTSTAGANDIPERTVGYETYDPGNPNIHPDDDGTSNEPGGGGRGGFA